MLCNPPPSPPPLLARPELIVREAATARGLPHPGTARGVDGLEGVGEGAGGMTWGEGDVLPSDLGGEGRDFRRAEATVGGACGWPWSGQCGTRGLKAKHHLPASLSVARFLPAFESCRRVILSCWGSLT